MSARRSTSPEADDAWFTQLYQDHSSDVLRYLMRRTDAEAARDLVADVFLTAWRRRNDITRDEAKLWLFGAASRLLANHRRAGQRQLRLSERIDATTVERHTAGADEGSEAWHVRAVLQTLSDDDQELLRLTEWEQLTPSEAAVVLGCSGATLRVRLHRARQRFAQALAAADECDTETREGRPS